MSGREDIFRRRLGKELVVFTIVVIDVAVIVIVDFFGTVEAIAPRTTATVALLPSSTFVSWLLVVVVGGGGGPDAQNGCVARTSVRFAPVASGAIGVDGGTLAVTPFTRVGVAQYFCQVLAIKGHVTTVSVLREGEERKWK